MRIILINQPLNNRGDESAHRALVRKVVETIPGVSITAFFIGENSDSVSQFNIHDKHVRYKSYLPQYNGDNSLINFLYSRLLVGNLFFNFLKITFYYRLTWLWWLNPLLWPLIIEILKADVVLNAPGGICMGGFQVWHHIAYLKLATKLGKDIYYYGRSIGPFPEESHYNIRFKEESIKLLKSFKFLSLRDEKSEKQAHNLGINYVPTVDSAFLSVPECEIPSEVKVQLSDNYVVFVPNVLRWHFAFNTVPQERITSMYISMIKYLHNTYKDAQIVMLPQTFNYKDPLWNDVNFFKELKAEIGNPDYIVVIDDIYSSDIQQKIISQASLIVGARYHSIVFGINNCVPFISLSYEHKMDGLLKILGCTNQMVSINDLSDVNKVNNILNEFKSIKEFADTQKVQQQATNIAQSCFEEFTRVIGGTC